MILGTIGQIGTDGAAGHVVEYAGEAIRRAVDGGPDDDLQHVDRGRRPRRDGGARRHHVRVRRGPARARPRTRQAVEGWRSLAGDDGAHFDTTIEVDLVEIAPQVSWGTNPGQVAAITDHVPEPDDDVDERALGYMDLTPGTPLRDVADRPGVRGLVHERADRGSARGGGIIDGRRVAAGVRAMVVPGSSRLRLRLRLRVWVRCSSGRGSSGAAPAAPCAWG